MPSGFALVFLRLSKFLLPEKSANARKSDAIFLYCVAGRLTQIAVGNYGFISLAPLRLVFRNFSNLKISCKFRNTALSVDSLKSP